MEIISYFDSKSLPIAQPTLEEMLCPQLSLRKKASHVKNSIHERETKVKQKAKTTHLDFHIIDVLYLSLIKMRYAFLAICAALLIVLGGIALSIYFQGIAKPVSFNQAVLTEEEILIDSMHNFVTVAHTSQLYEQHEALALLSDTDNASLYSQPVTFQNYTVKSGDSVHSITTKFGLDNISTIIGINDIDNVRLLWAGQKIIVPSLDGLMYEIKKGDTLDSIAKNHSISIEEILDVNELESSVLLVGEDLFIPGARLDSTVLRQAMGELFKHPLTGKWRLSSNYGYRADPFTGVRSFHTGADFAIAQGTPVKAAMSGTVSKVGYTGVYGNYVIINHGNGYQTLYAHFMSKAPVYQGQSVTQNSVIGYVGSTGYSTGPHLHFSVYKHGQLVSPRTVLQY